MRAAAARAVEQKFLLPEDAQSLIDAAQASAVLREVKAHRRGALGQPEAGFPAAARSASRTYAAAG